MPKVLKVEGGGHMIHCPACQCGHHLDGRWEYNDNEESPTFRPSLLTQGGSQRGRCHSFITDGKIQFLPDCSHELAGKTVDLPDWQKDIFDKEAIPCDECLKSNTCKRVSSVFGCIDGERAPISS
jgi:hypothetical protein